MVAIGSLILILGFRAGKSLSFRVFWRNFHARFRGVLAQLVERLNGIEEVRGSNPLGSRLRPGLSAGRLRLRCAFDLYAISSFAL